MRTFVMGDLHGAYPALMECLQRSAFDYGEDVLVQLGDVADGSDRVYECVDELLKIRRLIAIRGNHDEWFYEFIRTGRHPQAKAQGVQATANSYLRACGKDDLTRFGNGFLFALTPGDIPLAHRQFFHDQRPYFIDDRNDCFVHAGFDRSKPFAGQRVENYYWDRALWVDVLAREASVTAFREIFIGHTSTVNWGQDKPMHAANVWNVDTGASHGGRLTIMDVDTKEFWQSEPVIKARPFLSSEFDPGQPE